MKFIIIMRDLWAMRRRVGLVVLVAVVVGFLFAYRVSLPPQSRKYHIGAATVRVLVDTPDSQVIAVSPAGSETLSMRANLLASLVVDGVVKSNIARLASVAPNRIAAVSASSTSGAPPAKPSARGYALTTSVLTDTDGTQLPIIQIDTQAPDAAKAATLADAAVQGLRAYLDSQAAIERIPDASRLRVDGLGAAQAREVTKGPSDVLGLGIVLFMTIAGCVGLLTVPALVREWRATSGGDASDAGPAAGRDAVIRDFDNGVLTLPNDDHAAAAGAGGTVWAEVESPAQDGEGTRAGAPAGGPDEPGEDGPTAAPGASVSELPPRKGRAEKTGGRAERRSGAGGARARRS